VLFRHQSKPGRKVPCRREILRIANRGGQRSRCKRANRGHFHQPATDLVVPSGCEDRLVIALDVLLSLSDLIGQNREGAAGAFRNALVRPNEIHQIAGTRTSLRGNDAKLGQVTSQGVHRTGSLPCQEIARAMKHQHSLLLCTLDRNKPHAGSLGGLPARLGVCGVVFVRLHIGTHVSGWHEFGVMPKFDQFPGPMVSTAAGLKAYNATREP
jgi:hypothetical protein